MSPQPTIPAPQFPLVNKLSTLYAGARLAWQAYKLLTALPPQVQLQKTPWSPPQWGYTPAPVYLIDAGNNVYVFDAVFKLEHDSSLRSTEHPIQSGANIVDHSYQEPERLNFEVGMSDAMDNYFSIDEAGQPFSYFGVSGTAYRWADGNNKSASVFTILKSLQYARTPLAVQTRLNFYQNMIIEHIHTPDDFKTASGLRCIVYMKQIITAQISTVKVSARANSSTTTQRGVVPPTLPTTQQESGLSHSKLLNPPPP